MPTIHLPIKVPMWAAKALHCVTRCDVAMPVFSRRIVKRAVNPDVRPLFGGWRCSDESDD